MSIEFAKGSHYVGPKATTIPEGTGTDPRAPGTDQPGVPSGGPASVCNFTLPTPKQAK